MDLNLVYTVSLFFWRGEFCHEESHSNGVAIGSNQSASNRDGIISMITTVVSRGDHANNLPVSACLLSYNLHVRFFFEMKKKTNKRNTQATYVPIFSRRQTARGREFL